MQDAPPASDRTTVDTEGLPDTLTVFRRDEIFEWVCRYADEMDGPTPSINEIALHFKLNYKTVYYHVMKLLSRGGSAKSGETGRGRKRVDRAVGAAASPAV